MICFAGTNLPHQLSNLQQIVNFPIMITHAKVSIVVSGSALITLQVLVPYVHFMVADKQNWQQQVAFNNHVLLVRTSQIIPF